MGYFTCLFGVKLVLLLVNSKHVPGDSGEFGSGDGSLLIEMIGSAILHIVYMSLIKLSCNEARKLASVLVKAWCCAYYDMLKDWPRS